MKWSEARSAQTKTNIIQIFDNTGKAKVDNKLNAFDLWKTY